MLSLIKKETTTGWVSVLPRGSTIALVRANAKEGALPEILAFEVFEAGASVTDTLHKLRTSHGLKKAKCTTLMEEGRYSLVQLDAPTVPREERKEALRWALRDFVNFSVESACIEVLDLPENAFPQGRAVPVLVAAADEADVRMCAAPFEAAGVSLLAIDLPEMAQRNIAKLFEDENRGLVLVYIDENGMLLTLTFQGELVAVRRGDFNTLQLGSQDELVREASKERFGLELQRTLDNFDRQYSHVTISKVLLACSPSVEGLPEFLSNSTYVPVRAMNLSDVLSMQAVPELKSKSVQAKYFHAIGAALRTMEGA